MDPSYVTSIMYVSGYMPYFFISSTTTLVNLNNSAGSLGINFHVPHWAHLHSFASCTPSSLNLLKSAFSKLSLAGQMLSNNRICTAAYPPSLAGIYMYLDNGFFSLPDSVLTHNDIGQNLAWYSMKPSFSYGFLVRSTHHLVFFKKSSTAGAHEGLMDSFMIYSYNDFMGI